MLADPQSVTISGSAISLPRTSNGINSAVYTAGDSTVKLSLSHQYGRRVRRTVRLEHSKIAADPLSAANTKYSMTTYIVLDVPTVGYTVAEAKAVWDGFAATLAASSGALVTKVLGGEN